MKCYSRANRIPETHWTDTKSLERDYILGAQKFNRHRFCKNGGENKFQTHNAFQENASLLETPTGKFLLKEFTRPAVHTKPRQHIG